MRVVALTTLFPDASQPTHGVFVEQSLLRLAAQPGIELTVIAPRGVPPFPLSRHPRYRALARVPAREMWKGLDVARPRFALLPGVGWRINPWMIERAAFPAVAAARPDAIHADFFFPCGVAAGRIAARLGVPFTIKARGSDIALWGAKAPARAALVRTAAAAGRVLAVSARLRGEMRAMGLPVDDARIHYTGIDLDRFAPVDREAAKAMLGVVGPLVVSVGNLIALKGHDVVLRALALLPGVALRLIGAGRERERLQALIVELGLQDRAALVGRLPHEETARWLAAADVLALASAREGLANVWVEALASGTPVVTTDVGGAFEVLDRPEAGRLVERTPAAFATAIRALLDAPPAQADVRAAVAERFDWDRHAAELAAHLADVTRLPLRP